MPPASDEAGLLEDRLERGEIVTFDPCPFALPARDDRNFLLAQRPGGRIHKDISFSPVRNATTGFIRESDAQASRLHAILGEFTHRAAAWLGQVLPRYAARWQPDRVTVRSEEEAIRKLRLTARNDLLHVDAFPSRPTRGARILRLFVNLHATDPHVWATSLPFEDLFEKYSRFVGPSDWLADGWARRLGQGLLNLFQPGATARTPYDHFMLRLHHFLKTSDHFQERSPRKLWHFPPGSAWLLFTDGVAHAELRGQFALDHSFFIPQDALAIPHKSPFTLFEQAWRRPPLKQAV